MNGIPAAAYSTVQYSTVTVYNVLGTMVILPVTLYSIQGLMYSVPGTSYIMLGTVYSDQVKFKIYLVQCSALHAQC